MRETPDRPWYAAGLRFECTRCGNCCTGGEGHVWVDDAEAARLARFLGLTLEAFVGRHLRRVGERMSLLERPGGDCEFYDRARGCTVYEARPRQCRTFPFWPGFLRSVEAWQELSRSCPGIGRGPLHPAAEIDRLAAAP